MSAAEKFDADRQNCLAEIFRSLHHTGQTFVLPNAWDCASAKMYEQNGFPSIATTSAGVAWALGYKDGEHIAPERMIDAIARMTAVVSLPVSADIEGGYYRDDAENFSQFIEKVIDAGAIGINLEDGRSHSQQLNDVAHQVSLIKLAKEAGRKKGVNLFVNARTDAMLLHDDTESKLQICRERAEAFKAAGADGIFVPFVREMKLVEKLKELITLPLNILINDALNISDLRKLKVNRVSTGGRPMMATLNMLGKIARHLKQNDDWQLLFTDYPTYEEINSWFKD